jgi:hypothetical protein
MGSRHSISRVQLCWTPTGAGNQMLVVMARGSAIVDHAAAPYRVMLRLVAHHDLRMAALCARTSLLWQIHVFTCV